MFWFWQSLILPFNTEIDGSSNKKNMSTGYDNEQYIDGKFYWFVFIVDSLIFHEPIKKIISDQKSSPIWLP